MTEIPFVDPSAANDDQEAADRTVVEPPADKKATVDDRRTLSQMCADMWGNVDPWLERFGLRTLSERELRNLSNATVRLADAGSPVELGPKTNFVVTVGMVFVPRIIGKVIQGRSSDEPGGISAGDSDRGAFGVRQDGSDEANHQG